MLHHLSYCAAQVRDDSHINWIARYQVASLLLHQDTIHHGSLPAILSGPQEYIPTQVYLRFTQKEGSLR